MSVAPFKPGKQVVGQAIHDIPPQADYDHPVAGLRNAVLLRPDDEILWSGR